MEDRVKKGDGTDVSIKFGNIPSNILTVAQLIAYLEGGAPADIAASNTATVSGTPLNKANLLDDDVADLLGLTGANMVPNKAFESLYENKLDTYETSQAPTAANMIPLTHAGGQITVPATPILVTDAASKSYVDSHDENTLSAANSYSSGLLNPTQATFSIMGNNQTVYKSGRSCVLNCQPSAGSSFAANSVLGVLPLGFRPNAQMSIFCYNATKAALTYGYISSAGNIVVASAISQGEYVNISAAWISG